MKLLNAENKELERFADKIKFAALQKVFKSKQEFKISYHAFLLLAAIHELVVVRRKSFPNYQLSRLILRISNKELSHAFKELSEEGFVFLRKQNNQLLSKGIQIFGWPNTKTDAGKMPQARKMTLQSSKNQKNEQPQKVPFWRSLKPPVTPSYQHSRSKKINRKYQLIFEISHSTLKNGM